MLIKEILIDDYIKYKFEIRNLINDSYLKNSNINPDKISAIACEKTENLKKFILDGSAILIGCFFEKELIAFAWLYLYENLEEKIIHINQIVVSSSYRGKGIGRKMMKAIENEGLKRGINTIDLYVAETNKNAINLYNSLDYETEKRYMIKKIKVID